MPFFFKDATEFASSNGMIRFNDINSKGNISAAQVWLDVLDGWTTTVSPVVVASQKATGDGANIAKKFYNQGRVLMAGGIVATSGPEQTETAWNQLVNNAFPLNQDIRITNYGVSISKFIDVRVISDVRCLQLFPDGFRFEVDLMSEDSYLYDLLDISATAGIVGVTTGGFTFPLTFPLDFDTNSQGGSNEAILNNLGNAPTKPFVTIRGPLDAGWRLENVTTGQFISFNVGLPGGTSQLSIDFKKQTAFTGSTPVVGLVSGDWWEIAPGVNTIKMFGNYYADANFTITAKSAWR